MVKKETHYGLTLEGKHSKLYVSLLGVCTDCYHFIKLYWSKRVSRVTVENIAEHENRRRCTVFKTAAKL